MLKKFWKNEQGNIAMMFAVALIFLLGAIALAVDISKAYKLRSSLTDIADAAALGGAYAATTDGEDRTAIVQSIIDFHLAKLPSNIKFEASSINFDDAISELTVTLNGRVETDFASAIGVPDVDVIGQSVTTYAQNDINPISMAFVLDVSGSMNGTSSSGGTKLAGLQQAVSSLFRVIEETAPRKDVLRNKMRTGMTAFNLNLVPAHTVLLEFGSASVESRVAALTAGGDTNTTPAFELAMDMLVDDSPKPEGLREFIIFMSDGANDDPAENGNTILLCDEAKAQGLKVFSIAFEAPQAGQDLLRDCASGDNTAPGAIDPLRTINTVSQNADTRQYYFDAQNADELNASFRQIGEEIGKFEARIIR